MSDWWIFSSPIRQAVTKKSLGNDPPFIDLLATRLARLPATVNFIVEILHLFAEILKNGRRH